MTDKLIINDITNYKLLLNQIKAQIQDARIKASQSVNRELILLYWRLGEEIVNSQEKYGWGKSIVEHLSKDLIDAFGGRYGFSARNLWAMRQFYLEYRDFPDLQQLVAEIPWGQNLLIMGKVKDQKAKVYYLQFTKDMAWSRNVLLNQINSQAYERHHSQNKQHNFEKALPAHLAEQADAAMKDIYMLDGLGLTQPVLERQIEAHMVNKIKDVMMELGRGFAFIGNQYRISTPSKDYFIDLLFFNRRLKSLVALELKAGPFKPEYAGKVNFYLNLLDDFVKEKDENPSIGIILCNQRDHFEVEYSLRNIDKPVGVAEYRLTRELPDYLKGTLPDVEQLEEKILFELGLNEQDDTER